MASNWSLLSSTRAMRLYDAGKNFGEISRAVGRSHNATYKHIMTRLRRWGVEPRPVQGQERIFTAEEIETVRQMARDGTTSVKIRAYLATGSDALRRMLLANGIIIRKRRPPKPKPAGRPAIDFRSRATKARPRVWEPKPRLERLPRVPNTPWALNITFEQLRMFDCRFITTPTAKLDEARFCGQSVLPGHSWCNECYALVYRPEDRRLGQPTLRAAA